MRRDRQPATTRARMVRVALAVLAGLILAVAIDVVRTGGPGAWLARRGIPAPYVAVGERVDIGGRSVYLDCRGAGSPTVVLEAGMGSGAGAWSTVCAGHMVQVDRPDLVITATRRLVDAARAGSR